MRVVGVIVEWPDGTRIEVFPGGWKILRGYLDYGSQKHHDLQTIRVDSNGNVVRS